MRGTGLTLAAAGPAWIGWYVLGAVVMATTQVLRSRQERRETQEAIDEVERTQGRIAALEFRASLVMWNDRKLEAVCAEMEQAAGAEAAQRLRERVRSAREETPRLSRPVRLLPALAIGLPFLVLVVLLTAWILGR